MHQWSRQWGHFTFNTDGLSEENALKSTFPSEIHTITEIEKIRQNKINEIKNSNVNKSGSGASCQIVLQGEYLSEKLTREKTTQGKQAITKKLTDIKRAIKSKHDTNKDKIDEQLEDNMSKIYDLRNNRCGPWKAEG
ncbi:MAG: hypothetical protein GY820_10230 [Gammaproteobacteria bacterium]|nr:hypothetical protein [Gammaproteobacteria bacterium]